MNTFTAFIPAALLLTLISTIPLVSQTEQLHLDDFLPHAGNWETVGTVAVSSKDPGQLTAERGEGVIYNGSIGKTTNLLTNNQYKDVEVHVEFLVPKDSNSGIYMMGRYEIQIRDSFGKEQVRFSDAGGIYQRWKPTEDPIGYGWGGINPLVNAAKPPGEWQTLEITFSAPRFDKNGNKTQDARFIEVRLNGILVQKNQTVQGPTRAGTFEDESPTGPVMLQGDHGPVAFRNIILTEINLEHASLKDQ